MNSPLPPSWAITSREAALGTYPLAVTAGNSRASDSRDLGIAELSDDQARLAHQAAISLGGSLTGRGLNFLTYAVLARLLGPASLGLYAIGMALLQMFEGVARLGMSSGVVRLGTKYRRDAPIALRQVLTAAMTLTGGCGFLVAGCLWMLAPWIASEVFENVSLEVVIRCVIIYLTQGHNHSILFL